jgi:hypothetical protein
MRCTPCAASRSALAVDGARVRSAALWMPRSQRQALASATRPQWYARAGVPRHVGLVDGHHRQPQPPGRPAAQCAEEERAGQVDHLGPVPEQRTLDGRGGQAEPYARVARERH